MDSSKKYDNPHPREAANPISVLWFCWLKPLFFRKDKKKNLELKDLYNCLAEDNSEHLGDLLGKNWEIELQNAKKSNRKPKLLTALKKTFLRSYIIYGVWLFFIWVFLRVAQIYMLGLLIRHFDARAVSTTQDAYLYCSAVAGLGWLVTASIPQVNLAQQRFGMKIRVACSSLVYRKILRLSKSVSDQTASGQIVNLLSNDVSRFEQVFMYLHFVWIMPIQTVVITYLMWRSVQIAALAGVVLITLQTIPVQGYLSKWTSKLRMKIALRTDERVRLMSEIISGVQVIKMYAWEKPFEKLVSLARAYEIEALTATSYVRGFNLSSMVFTERTTLFFTVMAWVLLGNNITADTVFSMAQYFNILQCIMAIYYPIAVSQAAEALVSVNRIQKFLLLEENVVSVKAPLGIDEKTAILVKNVSAAWTENSITNTLHQINIRLKPGRLCAIVGSVGSGKSSFLQLLLGELPVSQGQYHVNGTISYASQEPWLFGGNVRHNILFGQSYDKTKYQEVTTACALLKDFEQFPFGDKSIVGEKGASLSGGQRARINLARAVYRDADVYLLDDPLSAVDTHVGKQLFDNCINGYLKHKTRILVTHQLQYLKDADLIVVLRNGKVVNQGTFTELQKTDVNFAEELNEEEAEATKKTKENPPLERMVSEISTVGDDENPEDEPKETEELMGKGRVSNSLYWTYFRAGGSIFSIFMVMFTLILGQLASSGTDYWLGFWTKQEEMRAESRRNLILLNETATTIASVVVQKSAILLNETATTIASVGSELLNNTTTIAADNLLPVLTNSTQALSESLPTADALTANLTETLSTPQEAPVHYYDRDTALWIYGACITGSVFITILRSLLFYKLCMNASKNLHDTMFSNILKAPMRFFDTNPAGRILNRFSKDIGAVDELLPRLMIESIQVYLVMTGILTQVIIINWWMIFPVLIMGYFYRMFTNIYMPTARDLKRLEGVSKSPVFSHVSSTLNGLTTIRATGAEEMVRKEFDIHQDTNTSAYFLTIAGTFAFGFWIDLVSLIFVSFVAFSFVVLDQGDTFAGNVGLALSQVMILCGMLQHGMRQLSEIITQMTSVERVVQFTKLEKEGPFESLPGKKPPATWPSKGQIQFNQAYLRYAEEEPPVLKDLNILIKPGMKVGIVGRTGAGKSSLISAVFNLAKIEGEILVDDIDIKKVGLHDLRTKISIIPQVPVLFSASVRDNLDPFQKFDDAKLWLALDRVELKDSIQSLDHMVNEGGSNFSAGQRQLVCLARAILRNNKILVLDEATANVDPSTDSLIQNTIRKEFANCTVLTIAHRLNTIMDSDRVLVMDHGEVVEFDHPHLLLQDENGHFSSMLAKTGKSMAEQLKKIAKEAYDSITPEYVPTHASNGNVKEK
ncbi:ATP-binding cassette sub-family C member 4-like [Athalia rosae]|uniref:ATP-binding cassette sub-family C member 4-like n=1 Tax=Athalia rosae TaxID=37344 RepID=UPI00203436B8|nr:ATP-binding cassette sub-family C member 4-like [Athalia rosae]